jgi:hypothetical protein
MISIRLRRLSPAVSLVALFIALLALVATAAGAGYAAATIGANDIKKNAVTSAKIKKNAVTTKKIKANNVTADKIPDGSLSASELVPEEAQHAATLLKGTEGDCAWQSIGPLLPGYGMGGPTFRKDRFGRVHLSGGAAGLDAAGGDGACDPTDVGQLSDGIALVLPAGYIPAKTFFAWSPFNGDLIYVVGAAGLSVPGASLPPGAIFVNNQVISLDSISFDPAGSSVVIAKTEASGRATGSLAHPLKNLG